MADSRLPDSSPRPLFAPRYVLLAVLVIGVYWFVSRRPESRLEWLSDFDTAVSQAQERDVPILLDFWADWCGPCLALDTRVFSSSDVASAASEKYVPMRVDLSNNHPAQQKIAERYGVETMPTILVLDAAGQKVLARASHEDESTPDAFLAFLKRHSR